MLRGCWGILSSLLIGTCVALLEPGHASAAGSLEGAWHAPSSCPSAVHADARLRDHSGGFSALAVGLAEVWIDYAPSGELRARLSLRHPDGREQRLLYGHDCEALSEAVLLVISMAFDPEDAPLVAPAPLPSEEPRAALPIAEPAPRAAPKPASPANETRAEAPRASVKIRLGAVGGVDHGSLPGASAYAGGMLAVAVKRAQVAVLATYFSRKHLEFENTRGAGAEFGLVAAQLRASYMGFGDAVASAPDPALQKVPARAFALGPSLALEAGAQSGRGFNLAQAAHRKGAWVAALLGLDLSLGPYGPVVPSASVQLGLALRRPRFELDDAGRVFQADRLLVRAQLGISLQLP